MKVVSMPETEARCERYTVTMGGEPADVLAARVSAVPFNCVWPGQQRPLDQTEIAGFVCCESDGPVNVCVTVHTGFAEVTIRPLNRKITFEREGDTLRFTLPGPGQYTLEPNDFHEALHLFVAPETVLPKINENTLYYGPGVHNIGVVELKSNQTVILDAGAVVYGGFMAFDAENITITGTGILDGSWEKRSTDTLLIPVVDPRDGEGLDDALLDTENLRKLLDEKSVLNGCVRLFKCKNCTVEHITCRDSSTFTVVPAACENIVIDDIKLIGMWRYNTDGIDIFNCTNVVIRNCFLRDFDDCVVIKGIGGWGHLNNENILVENCVVWCDWGRSLEIGAETLAGEYSNIIFRDCDLIHGNWVLLDIQHHNDAHIHDVTFENIRCEYTRHQLPLKYQHSLEVSFEEAEADMAHPGLLGAFFMDLGYFGPGHNTDKVERIRFTDIQVLSDEEVSMPTCRFTGLSESNCVQNILLDGIYRNGVRLDTPEKANLSYNEFCSDIILK